ncbi:MAG: hypothetical protein HY908_01020 [Myxococcales bacterium]|nr:hypothetical protein [Myxococcales bacterium]
MANVKLLLQAALGAAVLAASSAALAQPLPVNVTQMPSWLAGVDGMPSFDSATARLYPPPGGTVMLYDGDTLVGWYMQPGFVNLTPDHVYGIAVMSGTTMQFNSGLLVRKGITDVRFAASGYPTLQYYPSPAALYGYGGQGYGYGAPGYGYGAPGYGYGAPGYGAPGYGYGAPGYGYGVPVANRPYHTPAAPPAQHDVAAPRDTREAAMSDREIAALAQQMNGIVTDQKRMAALTSATKGIELRAAQGAELVRQFRTHRYRVIAAAHLKHQLRDPRNAAALDAAVGRDVSPRPVALPSIGSRVRFAAGK